MKTVPITAARQNLYTLIDETLTNSEPIQILSKRGSVILISLDDWNAMQETLYLESIPDMKKSILEASKESLNECKREIDWENI